MSYAISLHLSTNANVHNKTHFTNSWPTLTTGVEASTHVVGFSCLISLVFLPPASPHSSSVYETMKSFLSPLVNNSSFLVPPTKTRCATSTWCTGRTRKLSARSLASPSVLHFITGTATVWPMLQTAMLRLSHLAPPPRNKASVLTRCRPFLTDINLVFIFLRFHGKSRLDEPIITSSTWGIFLRTESFG